MFIAWIKSLASRLVPGKRVLLAVSSGALGVGLTVGGLLAQGRLDPKGCGAPEVPALDVQFIPLGKAYLPQLGKVYASAWTEGAVALESGQPPAQALQRVSAAWNAGRTDLFDRLIAPEFAKIVPEGQEESAITPEKRAQLARAWRGFAAGLSGTSP